MDIQSRRHFLSVASSVSAAGLTTIQPTLFPRLNAEEVKLASGFVKFRPEIEPLVRMIEDTSRDSIIDRVMNEIKNGTTYRELLGALFLAGIRNVQPRPAVGFKFHSVLVVHAAHQASLASRDNARWLPLLWAIDYFKSAQATDVKEGDWTMPAVNASKLPDATQSIDLLRNAFDAWDEPAADVAAAAATHVASSSQLFDVFARASARDFRSIGHKTIYVAGAFRTLQVIGWEHAEPVMRSLAYAILNHTGEENPAKNDYDSDKAGRHNWTLVDSISDRWIAGNRDERASQRVLEGLRTASILEAPKMVVDMLNNMVHPSSIYDGIHLAAAELVMRQPAIVPLHAVTTSNAMHYLFQNVADDRLRRWLLLQNASFLAHFRDAATLRDKVGDIKIDELVPLASNQASLDEIFAHVQQDRPKAAAEVLQFIHSGGKPEQLVRKAREFVFLKGNDSHDYKFSSAAIEDSSLMSPRWQPYYLAGCSYLLHGSTQKTTSLAQKILAMS